MFSTKQDKSEKKRNEKVNRYVLFSFMPGEDKYNLYNYIYIYIYIRFVPSSFPYFLIWNLYYYYYFKKHILVNHTVCTHNKPNYYLMKNHIKSSFCCQNMKWS